LFCGKILWRIIWLVRKYDTMMGSCI